MKIKGTIYKRRPRWLFHVISALGMVAACFLTLAAQTGQVISGNYFGLSIAIPLGFWVYDFARRIPNVPAISISIDGDKLEDDEELRDAVAVICDRAKEAA